MYDKSMGMCAADMCEGVHTHARRRFSSVTHVLSGPTEYARAAAGGKNDCGGEVAANLMVVGDSELACTAREARALHGMLATIHEVHRCEPCGRNLCLLNGAYCWFGCVLLGFLVHCRVEFCSGHQPNAVLVCPTSPTLLGPMPRGKGIDPFWY